MDADELFDWQFVPFDPSLYITVSEAQVALNYLERTNSKIKQSQHYKNRSMQSFCKRRLQHNEEAMALLRNQINYLSTKRGFNNSSPE